MIDWCYYNKFTALELELVRLTTTEYPSSEIMRELANNAAEKNIKLSIHGSLFINLATLEDSKVTLAQEHIKHGIRLATSIAGILVIHAGYFQNLPHQDAIKKVITVLNSLELSNPSLIFLETPGKINSIGSLSELLEIASQTGVHIAIDWGHSYARTLGAMREPKDILSILNAIENTINQKYYHMHISGIEYTKKGERRHMPFANSDFPLEMVIHTLQEIGISGTLICESPKRWDGDAELILQLLQGGNLTFTRKKRVTLDDFLK
jgi:deoxyribonuclease-4